MIATVDGSIGLFAWIMLGAICAGFVLPWVVLRILYGPTKAHE